MKKIYAIAISALCMAACGYKMDDVTYQPTQPSDGKLYVDVTLPTTLKEGQTKVSLTAQNGALKPAWQQTDAICINGEEFKMSKTEGAKATFVGAATSAKSFELVFPASAKTAENAKSLVPATQKQVGNDNVDHLVYYAALKGIKNLDNVEFTKDWAVAHGGSLISTTALKFVVYLPEAVTAVKSVSLVNLDDDSGWNLELENATLGADHKLVAYLQVSSDDISFADKQKFRFTAIDQDGAEVTKDFVPEAQTLYEGRINEFIVGGDWPTGVKKGKGSPDDPYIITNEEEFDAIRNLLENNVITCFRLDADLDMKDYTSWKPFNGENAAFGIQFDGNNHVIRNMKLSGNTKWLSIFGVLHGTVKDLTIENPELTNSYAAPSGILCAWAGNSDGSLSATIENVHIKNGKATMTNATNYFGGMMGNAVNSKILNCSYDGSVERAGGTEDTYCPVGGLIGWTDFDVIIEGCSTSGTLKCTNGRSCGGVIGYAKSIITVSSCSSSMSITTGGDCAGGICGWTNGGDFSKCHSTCTIDCGVTKAGTNTSYTGGIAAHISTSANFTDCSFVGSITAKGNLVGGIAGQVNAGTGTFRRCYVNADLKSATSNVGGITSRTKDKEGVIIENCYTKGSVTATTYVAGLVCDFYKDNVMRNCYSTMAVKGTYAVGGLICRCNNAQGSSVLMGGVGYNTTVTGCIAWNPSVVSITAGGEDPAGHYSGGAIIGYTATNNILSKNYRNPDMVFNYYAEGPGTTTTGATFTYSGYNEMYDQEDCDANTPLYRKFTDPTKDKYYFPYFGKAAPAGSTISSVARTLGWDEAVWDLSGSEPVLR